ncbi:MAG: hypothetical protein HY739_05400 [Desulfobacterales bacterium]|nr:hypothetical protein [Desulfobacterales bacterium]
MKVVIEVENEEEIKRVRGILKGEHITVVKTRKERDMILEDIFNKFNIRLPKDFKLDREELHAR